MLTAFQDEIFTGPLQTLSSVYPSILLLIPNMNASLMIRYPFFISQVSEEIKAHQNTSFTFFKNKVNRKVI